MTLHRGTLAAVIVAVAACGGALGPQAVPTEAEARAYLATIVERVAAGDVEGICGAGSGTCRQILRGADPARVPDAPPTVVGSRVLEPEQLNDGMTSAGGLVLELCGRDGLGDRYFSELLVFRDGDRLISTATPYWLGVRITDSATTGGVPPGDRCP